MEIVNMTWVKVSDLAPPLTSGIATIHFLYLEASEHTGNIGGRSTI